jgi:hypothetical protein
MIDGTAPTIAANIENPRATSEMSMGFLFLFLTASPPFYFDKHINYISAFMLSPPLHRHVLAICHFLIPESGNIRNNHILTFIRNGSEHFGNPLSILNVFLG